jgi:hypothetical protein
VRQDFKAGVSNAFGHLGRYQHLEAGAGRNTCGCCGEVHCLINGLTDQNEGVRFFHRHLAAHYRPDSDAYHQLR